MLKLRAEKAKMLGFDTYAAYALDDNTAKTPEAVNEMLGKLAPAAVANAKKEAADLQAMIDQEQAAKGEPTFKLEPWDWAFYTEKVRQAKYDFDESQLKPYLEMKNVLENGVFFAANQLYGISFKERTDLPKYHPDTSVYDVFDKDGSQLAIFIFDPYARASKRGGAWMNSYVSQSDLMDTQPVIANHLNIPKPPEGKPTLLTWEEVTTTLPPEPSVLDGVDKAGWQVASFIFDPYARASKRGGGWMNSYVSQSDLMDTQPVIANHLNIPKPPEGKPTLLTWDEVTTTFHEFGHALHGMFSDVKYPYFSGTRVPRDFVEFP